MNFKHFKTLFCKSFLCKTLQYLYPKRKYEGNNKPITTDSFFCTYLLLESKFGKILKSDRTFVPLLGAMTSDSD